MRLQFFGGVGLFDGEVSVRNFGTVRACKLLVLLALSRSGRMPRTHLADLLWPDDFYDSTRLRLRQEVHRLKRALGPLSDMVGSDQNDIWIERQCLVTDLDHLRAIIAGKAHGSDEQVFEGEFLPGWDEPWVLGERNQAEKLQLDAAIARGNLQLASGDASSALVVSQQMIAKHPLHEELRMVAVNAHASLGSVAAAVAEYQDLRRRVRNELGVELADLGEDLLLPPPVSLTPTNDWSDSVPTHLEPIFGREALIEDVLRRLKSVVTLVGPGGIGKTRLALEIAHRVIAQEDKRVAFATLIDAETPQMWARTVLKQLKEEVPGEAEPMPYLARLLDQKPTLLVLDNAETVLPDAEAELAELVRLVPSLTLLITSTVPTRLQREVLIPVGSIDIERAGLAMLESALMATRPSDLDQPGAHEALQGIAKELDGYPLALRLAAARFRLLSPQRLLEQLTSALSGAARADLPERHRSLEAALTSSLGTISTSQRRSLEQIAAFPGGVSMEMAAIVFRGENFLDTIESLLDLALITLDEQVDPIRVRLLAPIRTYLASSISPESQREHEAHAVESIWTYLQGLSVSPWTPLTHRTNDLLTLESENLSFAWGWSCAHRPEWALAGATGYVRHALARGLGPTLLAIWPFDLLLAQASSVEQQLELNLLTGYLAHACDRERDAVPFLEESERLLDQTGDLHWVPRVELLRAMCTFRIEFNEGEAPAQRALDGAIKANDRYMVARAHRLLGVFADFKNVSEDRIKYFYAAFLGFRDCNVETEAGTVGARLAFHLFAKGETELGTQILKDSRAMLQGCKEPSAIAFMAELEGRLALDDGKLEEAEQQLRTALRLWETIGSAFQEADQHHSLTRVMIAGGRWEEAQELIVKAGTLWYRDHNGGGLCCSIALGAEILRHYGHDDLARRFLAFSLAFEKEHDFVLVNQVLSSRQQLIDELGDLPENDWPLTLDQALDLFDVLREALLR